MCYYYNTIDECIIDSSHPMFGEDFITISELDYQIMKIFSRYTPTEIYSSISKVEGIHIQWSAK